MPALESRRVRTQPLTVTGVSCGAWPERISCALNSRLSIDPTEQMASPAGLEPATHSLGNCCSIRLSYGDINGLNFAGAEFKLTATRAIPRSR